MVRDASTEHDARFTVHGDGNIVGDDGCGGELARMILYVARVLTPPDSLLDLGELESVYAEGVERELQLAVTHDSSGLKVRARLATTGRAPAQPSNAEALSPASVVGLDYVLDVISDVELVAGCFLMSRGGQLVAQKVPGVPLESLANAGRRMKVTHDALAQMVGATSVHATFEWGRLLTAPVANGIAVAILDPSRDPADVLQAAHVGGLPLKDVDLDAHDSLATTG